MSPDFCEICGVSMDLHDPWDDDSCEEAELEAERIERIERAMFGWVVRG